MTSAQPRAAIDVGTNSVRLLVIDAAGGTLTRQMTITRLGKGVDQLGHLDDGALRLTLDTIAGYRRLWEQHGVDGAVRIAATSAVRDATDRDRFFDGVREVAGVDAEVLTGTEEAATSFAGAANAVPVEAPTVVLDIGGGSTELVVGGQDGTVRGSVSLQLGCVRLTERLLASDPPTGDQIAAARNEISQQLDHADDVLHEQGAYVRDATSLVGVAGTVTTLAALHLGLDAYEPDRIHGAIVPADVIRDLTSRLIGMPAAARRELGPMAPGREDVIAGGALVLLGVVERYGFSEVVASERDILDGLAASITPR